ncbi:myotubularin-related protein 9-like isoform X1 [Limulus polyphemus]|uniref:Myotubularin-related protein 9-like isoform X1 n=1 Tax=Limulus polyphemus TaxID=6850 RepID=A0ABM1BVD8_LIMPO|nr:myotubularin-related protein 9-like isoform X1 [Limulus polyphemus]
MEFAELIKTPKLDRVTLLRSFHPPVEGTLCITGHHVIFSSRKDSTEELWLLHRMVDSVERRITPTSSSIILKCKSFRVIHLEIPNVEDCINVANSVEWLSSIEDLTLLYPFFHRAMFDLMEDGWTAFLPEMEFSKIKSHSDEWRISYVNRDHYLCPSYPQAVIVPKNVDDDALKTIAGFRHLGRFPVLSYIHKETKAALLRSSQPMVANGNKRCKEDERLVNAALGTGKKGFIVDTRTQNLAQLAKTKADSFLGTGGGYEPEMHYPLWRRIHKPIDRYSTLLDSLMKLIEACNDTSGSVDKWLSKLESSGWLSHVKDILTCACLVAQCLDKDESSVLVHGGEGMDATLQVCALAQIILDPDCRTVRGFEALVEREWLQGGHPFTVRCQHGPFVSPAARTKEHSPTFLMFLDCVYQIHQQFACSFEFNEQFLVLLFEHSYASQFGTFLGNCDKERKELNLAQKTVSLWSHVNRPEIIGTYLNPMYDPNNKVIWPSVAPQSLVLWSGMYLRWVLNPSPQMAAWETIAEIREKNKELRSKAIRLRRYLMELEREAVDMGVLKPPPLPEEVPLVGS